MVEINNPDNNIRLLVGNHALLRRESFGGTLFFVKKGKRIYVTQDEFDFIKKTGSLPTILSEELGVSVESIIIREPEFLPKCNFSAPDTIFLEVTRDCNLKCTHCFNNSGESLVNQLTQSQFESVIDNLAISGVQEIRFTGGEPMTFPSIIKLIYRASLLGLRCSIGTNATLIDDYNANNLKEVGLRAGIISLDGFQKGHDFVRGQTSFQLALDGLERLRARNIEVRVNIVVMHSNVSDLPKLLEMFVERGIVVFMRRFILSGRALNSSKEILSEVDYADLRIRLKPLFDKSKEFIDGHYIGSRNVTTRIPLPFTRKDCSAGHRGLVVLSDGRIQTCGFLGPLGEKSIGKLSNESLAKVWARLNNSVHIATLESNLELYNSRTTKGPKTNCLAVALSKQKPLVSNHCITKEVPS